MKILDDPLNFILEQSRQSNLSLPEGFLHPCYCGFSIANLPSTICKLFGVPGLNSVPLSPQYLQTAKDLYQTVILLVIDGLGWDMLLRMLRGENSASLSAPIWAELLKNSTLAPLTSVVPSTTASALTTLWTGLTPAETGMLGYELWLKEYGMVTNMITLSPALGGGDSGILERAGFDPKTFIPAPVLGMHLSQYDIQTFSFLHQSIARSALSAMHMQGCEIFPYFSPGDAWVTLTNLLRSRSGKKTFVNIYWGNLDTLAHRFGPYDERLDLEFAAFGLLLKQFLATLKNFYPSECLFMMTADHGLIHTPRSPLFELKNYPQLMECLVMQPTGENRLSYIHLRDGKEDAFLSLVSEIWGDSFFLSRSQDLVEAGLFGSGTFHPHLKERMGDWVMTGRGNAYCWWQPKENLMLGRHGGLSPEEMLVPFAILHS